jgi:hypothetical protein
VQDAAKYQAHRKHGIDTDQSKTFFDEAVALFVTFSEPNETIILVSLPPRTSRIAI